MKQAISQTAIQHINQSVRQWNGQSQSFSVTLVSRWSHLDQGHVGAQGQQQLLGLGGVGVVPVLVQPMFQGSCHVLQGLSPVANFDPAQA